jgi:hypothetical protein
MEHKEDMTAQMMGAIEAQAALLESLIVALRSRKLADAATVDAVFARARAEFAKPRMAGSGGETAHTALEILEQMQTRIVGRARAMS